MEEGWFLLNPDLKLVLHSSGVPVWWKSETAARRAYDAGSGEDGATPVALLLKQDKLGYKGFLPSSSDVDFMLNSRLEMK